MKWGVYYRVGNTYKYKIVYADNANAAIRKARVKNIVDMERISAKEDAK